jgi:glutaredoxin
MARVVLFTSAGCSLCERARATLNDLRDELDFDYEEVAIDGEAELEARYREWLPVVEIDGERAFVYHVPAEGFRRKLGAQSRPQNPRM